MKPTTIRALAVIAGAALISAGVGMMYLPAGVITAGTLLFFMGVVGHMRGAVPKESSGE